VQTDAKNTMVMSAYCVICLKALKLTFYNKTLTKITKKTLKRHKILSASLQELTACWYCIAL